MRKIEITTRSRQLLADVHTPVGIYLRLRDRFRDTILLESTDAHAAENSFSFIGVNAIAGIEIRSNDCLELKYPGLPPERQALPGKQAVPGMIRDFMQRFEISAVNDPVERMAQGLFGYTSYDAVEFMDSITLSDSNDAPSIPLVRYRLYQYVIAINHFKDLMYICENQVKGIDSEPDLIESLIRSKDVPVFPFRRNGVEASPIADEQYMNMVAKGIDSCKRGDVFQIVLSRSFSQPFSGDEFNVYRALRAINPSPYLFYFDYGDYRLIGSSPESQLKISNGKALVHAIAGTVRRSGNEEEDALLSDQLLQDPKENAEHVMLVDLARNDLSRECSEVQVKYFRQLQYYSHVIHLVSEIEGRVKQDADPFRLLASTFPAGTLSGAPKFRAMQLINEFESTPRSYYGGCIGFLGLDGSCNHAIMIRTFLSRQNQLHYQAGAGVVAASRPESELQEVNNKLAALKKAVEMAENI